ncbi:MAG: GNAT family protein, partial [Dehalococcoidia bacterium]
SKWITAPKPPRTVEERRKAQTADLARGDDGKGHWWLIESDGDLAGTIALHDVQSRDRSAFVGYWLAEPFVGLGIMTASLKAIIDWAFDELGLIRVEIQCALANPRSTAVPERLGIRRESIRRQSQVTNGVVFDMASYAALADNWPPKAPSRPLPHREIRVDDEILLRPSDESDRDAMWKALDAGRDYIAKYLPWMAGFDTEEKHALGFNKRHFEKDLLNGGCDYIVEYKGQLAGTAGFPPPNRDNGVEIGYWLRQDLQGRGIITRTVSALIDMAIVQMGLHRVTIRAATSNLPSRAIPERLGFKHEGTMREASFVNDEYMDLEIYSILDHEWIKRSKNA